MPRPVGNSTSPSAEMLTPSRWHTWLHKACEPAFYMGGTLVLLSLGGNIKPTLGWFGIALACPAILVLYLMPCPSTLNRANYVILNVHLLHSKGGAYHNAIDRFRNGTVLIYEGISFGVGSNNEISGKVVVDRTELASLIE